MRTIKRAVDALSSAPLPLGTQGDTGMTRMLIDLAPWRAQGLEGAPAIECESADGEVYPVAPDIEGDLLIWTVSGSDTARTGEGKCRVMLYGAGGELIQSAMARTIVLPALAPGDAPDRYEDWLQALSRQAAQTTRDAEEAEQSRIACKQSEMRAEVAAQAAKVFSEAAGAGVAPGTYIDTAMPVHIEVAEWVEAGGGFAFVMENPLITSDTAAILMPDESAEAMEAGIALETVDGAVTLSTAARPSGTISGTIALIGKFHAVFD